RSLGFAVLFGTMPTGRACTRGITRIDEVDRHTAQLSFVADKCPELREGPGVECCALRPSSPHPRANVRQFFQRNRALRAFGLRNNPFGETVVDVLGKSAFLSSQFPQAAAATERNKLQKLVPQAPLAIAHVLDRLTRVDFAIAISGDI